MVLKDRHLFKPVVQNFHSFGIFPDTYIAAIACFHGTSSIFRENTDGTTSTNIETRCCLRRTSRWWSLVLVSMVHKQSGEKSVLILLQNELKWPRGSHYIYDSKDFALAVAEKLQDSREAAWKIKYAQHDLGCLVSSLFH